MKNPVITSTFPLRLNIYLIERFHLLQHTILIGAFTFSAISYSRLSRGAAGFISSADFLIAFLIVFLSFLLLRILDEHKDAQNDRLHRQYLPVPRGVVSLSELRKLGITIALIQIILILLWQPEMWWLFLLYNFWLMLMTLEFFVPQWLNERPLTYMISHMAIIPLIDLYSSGVDWKLNGAGMHPGLIWFIGASFFNGMILEVGRKIRMPKDEEIGVKSYSEALGIKGATWLWIALLFLTMSFSQIAIWEIQAGWLSQALLIINFSLCIIPAILFLWKPTTKKSKWIEITAGIWSVSMYLILGGLPMLIQNFTP